MNPLHWVFEHQREDTYFYGSLLMRNFGLCVVFPHISCLLREVLCPPDGTGTRRRAFTRASLPDVTGDSGGAEAVGNTAQLPSVCVSRSLEPRCSRKLQRAEPVLHLPVLIGLDEFKNLPSYFYYLFSLCAP